MQKRVKGKRESESVKKERNTERGVIILDKTFKAKHPPEGFF